MAYNQKFNPDSLPAFAEPERKHSNQQTAAPAPQRQSPQPQYNKPPPPAPPPSNYGPGRLSPQNPLNYGYNHSPSGSPGFFGNRPTSSTQNRPSQPMSVSSPPALPNGGDPALWPLFKAVDKAGSGRLTERELGAALVNGDWSSFDPQTVKMMIRMFDTDRDGSIQFPEFCGLWGFLSAWRNLFDRFDADKSGNISKDEYTNALVAFGYRLSPQFIHLLFTTYDKKRDGAISFDLFVQSCISLKRMTDVFKKYDDDRDGFITLSFENFLTEIIKQN